jgi:hypothetical protein
MARNTWEQAIVSLNVLGSVHIAPSKPQNPYINKAESLYEIIKKMFKINEIKISMSPR